ncbi:loricrin, putative [Trichomonas vaginalis G3]|uniref:receptor protein-tyrosine kinase n=1 Tax=Trichomonas vaginalis (strain ATCC PRA-98 / G3) TaxID=412133 RepID=A2GAF7_TRIV3|nr:glycine-rich protein family [Trichomonas vaginalis G3]EAX85861.1 loricrin, putative [Trichomonas vaginalis G3]KAI5483147.1 glycine-rich protein family [Trichomonas vaginalis G3]|eukprot:XP_001298791.1 loricrin [Trichomonas vaginalis G3]
MNGGYGGGGSSSNFCGTEIDTSGIYCGTGSGGGQTAVKFLENDLWHRVLVSGGGGGCDNAQGDYGGSDDGSGGAGGNFTAQSWFANGVLSENYFADSEKGFSFGVGEAARYGDPSNNNAVPEGTMEDNAGGGGGWFGGFSGQIGSSGAGGGSSWALTKDAIIPKSTLTTSDEFYKNTISRYYAFGLSSGYLFEDVVNVAGIWNGNGRVVISIIKQNHIRSCSCRVGIQPHFLYLMFFVSS